jgi:hypothetical protein
MRLSFKVMSLLLLTLSGNSYAAGLSASPPDWNADLMCSAVLVEPLPLIEAIGIPLPHVSALVRYARESNSHVLFLKPVEGSFRFHGKEDALAKPMKIILGKDGKNAVHEPFLFKSARQGPFEGAVIKPSPTSFRLESTEYREAKEIWDSKWPIFEKNGFTIDENGLVRDLENHFFFSDFDLVAVIDSKGKRKSFGSDADTSTRVARLLRPLNENLGLDLFRHDGFFEKFYLDELMKTEKTVLILNPKGDVWVRAASDLPEIFKELGYAP